MARHRSPLLACAALLLVGILSACGGSEPTTPPSPVALTQEQAELLATTRFRNFDAGVRSVSITIPDQYGEAASVGGRIDGWVDFANHLGYASVQQGGTGLGAMLWNGERIAVNESAQGPVTLPIPRAGWRGEDLVARASRMTQALTIVLNLGSDRPENPLLLRQSDAAFLRDDTIGSRTVVVLAGPSPGTAKSAGTAPDDSRVRYWIDSEGMLMRVQLKLAGGRDWTVIDLDEADDVTIKTPQTTRALAT